MRLEKVAREDVAAWLSSVTRWMMPKATSSTLVLVFGSFTYPLLVTDVSRWRQRPAVVRYTTSIDGP